MIFSAKKHRQCGFQGGFCRIEVWPWSRPGGARHRMGAPGEFSATQFNFVVSTNTRAIALWKNLGFSIIGTIPQAFQHQGLGRKVDAFVMHRFL